MSDEITGTAIHIVRRPRGQPVLIAVRWDEGTPAGTPFRWGYVGSVNTRPADNFPFRVRTGLDENVVYDLKPDEEPVEAVAFEPSARDLESEMDEAFAEIPERFRREEDLIHAIRNVVAALPDTSAVKFDFFRLGIKREYPPDVVEGLNSLSGELGGTRVDIDKLEERVARPEEAGLCDNCAAAKAGGGYWPEALITKESLDGSVTHSLGHPTPEHKCEGCGEMRPLAAGRGTGGLFLCGVCATDRAKDPAAWEPRLPPVNPGAPEAMRKLDEIVVNFRRWNTKFDTMDDFAQTYDLTVVELLSLLDQALV